jgi:hypothetical protein
MRFLSSAHPTVLSGTPAAFNVRINLWVSKVIVAIDFPCQLMKLCGQNNLYGCRLPIQKTNLININKTTGSGFSISH